MSSSRVSSAGGRSRGTGTGKGTGSTVARSLTVAAAKEAQRPSWCSGTV